MGGNRFIWTQ